MKMKRVLSMALALSLIFGSAAALPEGTFTRSTSITASAEGDAIVSGDYKYKLLTNGTAEITEYTGTDATVTIPSKLDEKTVSSIGAGAFNSSTDLKRATVPDSIQTIGDNAFDKGCTIICKAGSAAYTYAALNGNKLEYISGNYVFKELTDETVEITEYLGKGGNITIPSEWGEKKVTSIGTNAFKGCATITSVIVADTVTTIKGTAFVGCPNLKSAFIPKTVTSIGNYALGYVYDDSFMPVVNPDFVMRCYKDSAADTYAQTNKLNKKYIVVSGDYEYFELSDGTVEIVKYTGEDEKVTIPTKLDGKTVSSIGAEAFKSSTDLKRVNIPESVLNIGNNAFDKGCTIICKAGSAAYTYAALNGNKLEYISGNYVFKELTDETVEITEYLGKGGNITIPSEWGEKKVTSIGTNAFKNCTTISDVTIADSVTTIKSTAFIGCTNLKSATIPENVTLIGSYAFGYVYDDSYMPVVNSDFVIKCYKDSAADTYAKNNKLNVEYIDVEHVAAKAAGCTEDGNIEYWVNNEKYYSDKELTKEITKDKTVVKASHSFPEKWSVVKQPTIVGAGVESRKCTVCGLTETRPYGTALVTDRAAGKNRFATSLEIAEKFKNANAGEPLKNVIIASGTDFADALSATYLANVKNAPILITAGDTKSIIDPIYSFIDKSSVKNATVFIIGGVNVVPESVVNTLKAKGYNVKRLAGRNRFLTNIEVLKEADVKEEELLIASGTDYADALSASAVGKPILLVSGKAAGMTADQKNYLKTLSSKNGYVIGGANAVSSGIEKDAKAFMNVQRVMGQNRFETSVAVAEKFFKKPTAVAVAYGLNYPDGLCGGPLALAYGCPLLLTVDTRPDAAVNYAKSVSVKSAVTFGGASLVSDKTINKIIGK